MQDQSWKQHNQMTESSKLEPSAPLAKAIELLEDQKDINAADLGCGSGIDTITMLQLGWRVMAIDQDEETILRLTGQSDSSKLSAKVQTFEDLRLPKLDLINASMALPFCQPNAFHSCWNRITTSLKVNGIFCGHFFGIRDSWGLRPTMNFVSGESIGELLKDYEILWLEETEKDGQTLNGKTKHWHIFSVVARKIKE